MQTSYAIVYLEINLMASLLVAIIRIKTTGISQMVAQRNFSMAMDSQVVFFLSDTACVMMLYGILPYSRAAFIAAKTVYFLATALMCFFWFVYFELLQGSRFIRRRRAVWLCSCLVWIMAILLAVNLFTGILFRVDADGVYRRGPLFAIQYLLSYVYVFAASLHALLGVFKTENFARRRLLVSLALFPVAPAGAGILQFIYPQLPLACAALSLAALVMYHGWLDELISLDPLTHLNNRKQLMYYYEHWRRADRSPLLLILIDANRFKSINDIYGHSQGDAALVNIADALRQACKDLRRRANICRYGGDEFVLLVSADEDADALRRRIDDYLSTLSADAPYELTVSVGITPADPELSVKDLIVRADEKLYAEKERLKRAV